jgi:hypothetical protein
MIRRLDQTAALTIFMFGAGDGAKKVARSTALMWTSNCSSIIDFPAPTLSF